MWDFVAFVVVICVTLAWFGWLRHLDKKDGGFP